MKRAQLSNGLSRDKTKGDLFFCWTQKKYIELVVVQGNDSSMQAHTYMNEHRISK